MANLSINLSWQQTKTITITGKNVSGVDKPITNISVSSDSQYVTAIQDGGVSGRYIISNSNSAIVGLVTLVFSAKNELGGDVSGTVDVNIIPPDVAVELAFEVDAAV